MIRLTSIVKRVGLLLSLVVLAGCATTQTNGAQGEFSITRTNPDTMVDPTTFGYTHVVTVNNGRIIYLAGQGPTNIEGKNAAPGDLRGQTRQAVDNILNALAAVGAGPENIVKLRINVANYTPRKLIDIAPEISRLTAEGGKPPASILVGVKSLVLPTTLIEIETVAAIP